MSLFRNKLVIAGGAKWVRDEYLRSVSISATEMDVIARNVRRTAAMQVLESGSRCCGRDVYVLQDSPC